MTSPAEIMRETAATFGEQIASEIRSNCPFNPLVQAAMAEAVTQYAAGIRQLPLPADPRDAEIERLWGALTNAAKPIRAEIDKLLTATRDRPMTDGEHFRLEAYTNAEAKVGALAMNLRIELSAPSSEDTTNG